MVLHQNKTGEYTDGKILTSTGISNVDIPSPILFNLIMDRMVDKVRYTGGYRIWKVNHNILCYVDEARNIKY